MFSGKPSNQDTGYLTLDTVGHLTILHSTFNILHFTFPPHHFTVISLQFTDDLYAGKRIAGNFTK
ncbi:hypothetical protein GCM10027516_28030 [Niabella aquatica]